MQGYWLAHVEGVGRWQVGQPSVRKGAAAAQSAWFSKERQALVATRADECMTRLLRGCRIYAIYVVAGPYFWAVCEGRYD